MTEKETNIRNNERITAIFGMIMMLCSVSSLSTEINIVDGSTFKIYSQILDEDRTLSIALPDEYDIGQNEYPVLYVLDAEGSKLFPECVSTVVDLYKKGLVPQMIIVGIWNTARNRDMIPVSVSHRPGSGGSKEFLSFIKDELMPHIAQNYRTMDFSILYGMSNSALFTIYVLLESPETFNAYIASSPMIGHCPDYIKLKADLFVEKNQLEDRILYMIYGTEDSQRVTSYIPDFQKFLEQKIPKSFNSELAILEGEGHVPDSSLEKGLQYVFSKRTTVK
ncbi:MAG: alpha/beta hydrolase-fold protein [Candidatus Aminicenantes bacterium]|jgi:predicted alpha/beta superfamily hydrolase